MTPDVPNYPATSDTESPRDDLPARELALRSHALLDLPPRTTRVVLGAGLIGLVIIVVQSLVGNRAETVAVDTLLHLGAYAALAALGVLALRPRHIIGILLLLVGLSYAIELIQPLTMRTRDAGDALANTVGVALGAAIGLLGRLLYSYLHTELTTAHICRALVSIQAGTTIVRAGEPIDRFWIIQAGQVGLYLENDGALQELDRLGPGEMFGLLAEIEHTPQPLTVVALSPVQIYRVDYDELIDAVGGAQQPLGIVVRYLATELRQASLRVAKLQQAAASDTHIAPAD